ncbi:MAG TPA: L-2-hydroxyglutarate oxidase [Planctomycetota bacterium]|nr:L-2-hydroxyglutarate oxidase [Planctomycetota bacterium]
MSAPLDVVIVGGGIVGLATALAILKQKPATQLVVLEKEPDVARHQTGNNSGVIHSGIYYKPGSAKARTCVEGRQRMLQFCAEHRIPHTLCGKVVVATCEEEVPRLEELARRARANDVPDLKEIGPEQLRELEPYAAGLRGLHVPGTGIVDFGAVARKMAELIRNAGGRIDTGTHVTALRRTGDGLVVLTNKGEYPTRTMINCGGLQCDRVAWSCGSQPGLKIVPFRGEYYTLKREREHLVKSLIYPVPDPRFPFLGVHFTRMQQGGVEAGPNAVLALKREGYSRCSFNPRDAFETLTYPGFWRMASKYWKTGCGEMYRSFMKGAFVGALQRLVPEITSSDLEQGGAGVRAQALLPDGSLVDDFQIVQDHATIHVLNAPSPAATASLAIGEQIAAQWAKL